MKPKVFPCSCDTGAKAFRKHTDVDKFAHSDHSTLSGTRKKKDWRSCTRKTKTEKTKDSKELRSGIRVERSDIWSHLEGSWRQRSLGDTQPRRCPGCTQEPARKHLGTTQETAKTLSGSTQEIPRYTQEHPGDTQKAPRKHPEDAKDIQRHLDKPRRHA